MKNLYLIGFMGAGKSTIAKVLAKKCPAKRIEMDQLIEEQQGMAITDIFAAHGENYYHEPSDFKREYECGIYPGTDGKAPAALRSGGGYLCGHGRQGRGCHQ